MADEGGREWVEKAALGALAVIIVVFALAYLWPKPTTEYERYGVRVVSEMPLERLQAMHYIALYNTTVSASELTCKFELSAISEPSLQGYRIRIDEGDQGLYLGEKEARIRGGSDEEILESCHVFACLREGIECMDFGELEDYFRGADGMSVILDEDAGVKAGRGYAEIMGALSFMQTKRADLNRNEAVEQWEVDENDFFIYPFLMSNGTCRTQPFSTVLQNWSGTNQTYDCSNIGPAVVLRPSNTSSIRLSGGQVVLTGDDDRLHSASVILRDVIAPEWIRRLYGYR